MVSSFRGKILVVRGGAIGDFILTLPAIAALRGRFPLAQLEVMGYPHIIELAVAGGLRGSPLPVVKCITNDLFIPSETEIVLEGRLGWEGTVREGPFAEFIGYLSPEGDAPVFDVAALTHRTDPIYPAINGYGRETVMLRKYVMEASLLKALQASVPIIHDAEMGAGPVCRPGRPSVSGRRKGQCTDTELFRAGHTDRRAAK